MTPEAKKQLSNTIRSLRASLLDDLQAETGRVYRLAIKAKEAELNQAMLVRRQRLEAWLDEQVRAEALRGKQQRTRDDFRDDVVKQAAYTLLNRLVFLRLLEAFEQRSPHVVTGGWNSLGYKNFREVAPALLRNDETEGYAFLLKLVFEDLAVDLPGLYGPAGMADLIPIPAKTLRAIVDAFDDKELRSCWTDDMTLGWVYQYWNDPEREALDDKINAGGKIEPHEIASKTQMFTERYMVDWLLQNSLGPMWLAMCKRHGWTPEVEADGTLDRLEQRRIEWRAKRDERQVALAAAKQRQEADPSYQFEEKKLPGVSLTELMPLNTDAERRWAYYVPQPIPQDAIDHAQESVRELKILDPAVGSGHFLVVAFDLLFALYKEEARHRNETGDERWSDRAIVEQILGHNLHGIDLDPRAVQIAAAALWLKGRLTCAEARPEQLNLVASNLRLASLPDDDPALVELRRAVEAETGIPGTLTDEIVHALRGADHLGSLLKVDAAVEDAITRHETQIRLAGDTTQKRLFDDGGPQQQALAFPKEDLKATVLERLEEFMSRHTGGDDLGLRLRGEQLTAGVRFLRLVREETYDLVVGNPPYQGTSIMRDAAYVRKMYSFGKSDLYAAMLVRSLELVRHGGTSAILAMRNWMFIKQYVALRRWLLGNHDLRAIGDFDKGAFETMTTSQLISVALTVVRRGGQSGTMSVAIKPTAPNEKFWGRDRTEQKRAAVMLQVGKYDFLVTDFDAIIGLPLIYWWTNSFRSQYMNTPKLVSESPVKVGLASSGGDRFSRFFWEVSRVSAIRVNDILNRTSTSLSGWVPIVKGAKGKEWIEPLVNVVRWVYSGMEIKLSHEGSSGGRVVGEKWYGTVGLSYPKVSSQFS